MGKAWASTVAFEKAINLYWNPYKTGFTLDFVEILHGWIILPEITGHGAKAIDTFLEQLW